VLVGAALYDPFSGLAVFPLPAAARAIPPGKTRAVMSGSDYQETKNVNTISDQIMPNTAFTPMTITGVRGPAVTWLLPARASCVARNVNLTVTASSDKKVASVRFLVDGRQVARDRSGAADVFNATWHAQKARRGGHRLNAVATDVAGRRATAKQSVRVCR